MERRHVRWDGTISPPVPETKAGARTVALDPGTVDALKGRKAEQNEHRMLMGTGWPRHGLVFTHADGTGYLPQLVTARFKTIAEQLDMPTIGVHGLRHSARRRG